MKITKTKLKQIIREEFETIKEVQGKEWVDVYVARIQNHLDEKHTEGRGMLMELVTALARAAKGEQS